MGRGDMVGEIGEILGEDFGEQDFCKCGLEPRLRLFFSARNSSMTCSIFRMSLLACAMVTNLNPTFGPLPRRGS